MTVIAWDGKVLAADRMSHIGGTPLPPMRKIHRLVAPNGKQALMLIEQPRWVWYRSDNANRWDLLGACSGWAIGSGCDYALGAMEAGATAQEAVRIASRLDNQCGMGVDVVRFR